MKTKNYLLGFVMGWFMLIMNSFVFGMKTVEEGGGSAQTDEEIAFMKKVQDNVQNILSKNNAGYITDSKMFEKLEEKGLSKESVDKLKEQLKTLEGVIEKQGLSLKKFEEKTVSSSSNTLTKAFEERAKAISEGFDKKERVGVIEIKAAAVTTTANAATSGTFSALHELINSDDIQGIKLRNSWIENWATVTRTAKATYSFSEYEPKDGDASFVAESGTKPLLDVKVTTKAIAPKKAAAYSVLTTEARDDVPRMESETKNVIAKKVALRRQNGILFGDGTGENPEGVTEIASAFDAATWPAGELVKDPNIKDVIIAVKNQIETTHNFVDEEAYMPNLVILNTADYNAHFTRKDDNGQYLFGAEMDRNGVMTIGSLSIISHRDIAKGKILVGDFTKLNIINYIDFAVETGLVNDQFIKNQYTLLGENRFFTYVRTLDKVAFVYDDIQDVKDGIKEIVA